MAYSYLTLAQLRGELLARLQDSGAVFTTAAEADLYSVFLVCCTSLFSLYYARSVYLFYVLIAIFPVDHVKYSHRVASVLLSQFFHGRFPLFIFSDYFNRLIVREFSVFRSATPIYFSEPKHKFSVWFSSAHSVGASCIFFACYILKIVRGIVEFIAIYVIDNQSLWARSDKTGCYDAMDGGVVFAAIRIKKRYDSVSIGTTAFIDRRFDLGDSMYTSIRTYEIMSSESWNLRIPYGIRFIHNPIVPYNIIKVENI